ncbi:MAG: M28 family peptidase, partial [Planctomycetota bacterium]
MGEPAASGRWRAIAIVTVALALIASLLPIVPAPVAADAAVGEFSSARAWSHLEHIAAEPHPLPSPAHARVHAYLVRTLRDLAIQTEEWDIERELGDHRLRLRNILARVPGSDPARKAVLLVAHHDSAPRAPGAGDDGAAVAALLETLRALAASPPLAADVLALFTDGEERGLLGAQACAGDARLASVGVVLNFEARGNRGASLMFETSTPNRGLIDAFAQAAPCPTGSSLMGDVYRRMPNDTDFTIFREHGFRGLNFAFIGGYDAYHQPWDSVANLAASSLQHHGAQMLALARRFATHELQGGDPLDAVYFNLGPLFVHYPATLVWPLTIGAVALLLVVLVRSRAALAWRPLLAAMIELLGALVLTTIVGFGVSQALLALVPGSVRQLVWGHTRHDGPLLVLLALVALMLAGGLLRSASRRIGVACLFAAALCVWVLALVAASCWLPGGSYLFLWPIVPVLIAACTTS